MYSSPRPPSSKPSSTLPNERERSPERRSSLGSQDHQQREHLDDFYKEEQEEESDGFDSDDQEDDCDYKKGIFMLYS